ncbi:hypothetical protein [Chitinophaga pinensis]|uniref:Protochlamydia outer membrane protein domain-containing protein n=1 Tax=Chitinophaga pinensis (strain ATCC 43595 / DSM 2588 / LMG 13176 / NBRC 15968 / NCIMB 11800 / UQM 2034) TaxID=485918 RepID=A0A979G8V5_CHIPD|nr:hypothetical protein [Chitinophaga pinensis]ACU62822.1 hypothetical protein Cpin_5392 [Chitinophaga pinensis DSM 2588]
MEIRQRLGKLLVACCAYGGCFTSVVAQQATPFKPILRADIAATGVRNHLIWSVAGNSQGTAPNIMSELEWYAQSGIGMKGSLTYQPFRRWFTTLSFSRAGYISGHATDNDYQEDDRQYPTFAGKFRADRGRIKELHGVVGFELYTSGRISWNIQTGYTEQHQLNYLLPADVLTPQDLRTTYFSKWSGMLINTAVQWQTSDNTLLRGTLAYSQLWYRAEADWNLIPSFQHPLSFLHVAKGYGLRPAVAMEKRLLGFTAVQLELACDYRITGHGSEQLYLRNGGLAVTRLNSVKSRGWSLSIGVPFSFLQ